MAYRDALRLDAGNAQAHNNLGGVLRQTGDQEEAERRFRLALGLDGGLLQANLNLGRLLSEQGRVAEAVAYFEHALEGAQDDPEIHNDLGNALARSGRFEEALTCYRRVLAIDPNLRGTLCNMGNALREMGRPKEAAEVMERALNLNPEHQDTAFHLGVAYLDAGEVQLSEIVNRRIIDQNPGHVGAHVNLGNALVHQGRADEAVVHFEQAIGLKPEDALTLNNLGAAYRDLGETGKAITAYRKAIAIDPGYAIAYSNLGVALQDRGSIDEAIEAYRKSIQLDPSLDGMHSNLLLCLHYRHGDEAAVLYDEHQRWAASHAKDSMPSAAGSRGKKKRLKVAYLSPDFRCHSVAYFFEPLLENHDKAHFEIHCYANSPKEDEVTFRLQALAGRWRNIYGLPDSDVAQIVREDGIDILVDLAGHTGGNRLRVFASRPAPVQVTYLGYPDTTGLTAIDYRLTDAETDPPGLTECYHSERLVRLPNGFLCYRPPELPPVVPPVPAAATNGHVTFACFNNFAKLSPRILRVWARILAALPTARLMVKSLALADAESQQFARDYFSTHGIPVERIVMLPRDQSAYDHLRRYADADIALDVYPYAGTTTTFEALFMGLPVVSLRGPTHVSRVGGSILPRIGAADWVCDDDEAYVAKAVALAGDLDLLGELRRTLRQRLLASPLCDAPAFARQVEEAYLGMWEQAGA